MNVEYSNFRIEFYFLLCFPLGSLRDVCVYKLMQKKENTLNWFENQNSAIILCNTAENQSKEFFFFQL